MRELEDELDDGRKGWMVKMRGFWEQAKGIVYGPMKFINVREEAKTL